MDRTAALSIIDEYVKTDVLRRHLLSVEAAMRAYADEFEGDPDRWALAGLLHDFDWESVPQPDLHPTWGADILRARGVPEDIVRAVLCHGDHTGLPRETPMEKTLYAVDELCGFIIACALVRPNRSLSEVTPDGVRRKMKDRRFAAAVRREDIVKGAAEMGVDMDKHVTFVRDALGPVATELGLRP